MSIISQLNTANTFSQWLTATQDLVTKTNSLIEGGGSSTFYSNTNLSVANNLTIGGDLTVSGNIASTEGVTGGGISLENHTHPDPQGGTTGTPI